MKVQKAKWVAVNYETGEVLQVASVMTRAKAMKIFNTHQGYMGAFKLVPSIAHI
jgi:hypothetical protein